MSFKIRILLGMVATALTASISVVTLIAGMSITELDNNIHKESQRDLIAKREPTILKVKSYFSRIQKQIITLSANNQTELA